MDDKKIRRILIEYLCERYEGARIYEERGIGDSVCDLMLVTNCLIGFEIKSDQDNLQRLARQVLSYSAYFDKNYIVVGEKYASTILGVVPSEWGVLVVGEASIELQREAKTSRTVNVGKQLSLLWSIELKNLLLQNNLPLYAQKTPAYIRDRLMEGVDTDKLKVQIVKELRSRDDSLLNNNEFAIEKNGKQIQDISGLSVRTLLEALSEQSFDDFSLADWVSLYRKGKELHKQKQEKVVSRERSQRHLIPYTDITVALGVPWVGREIIKDFILFLLKLPADCSFQVNYEPITGNWAITNKTWIVHQNRTTNETYGSGKKRAVDLIEDALNLREVKVYQDGTKRIDEQATLAALEKQQLIQNKFLTWIWQDEDRRWEVEAEYNRMFADFEKKTYDGSKLTFPESNTEIELFPYQKDAVQKIISTPNTLLSFDVGAGKTYIMIAAAMEMRRMGMSRKNLFVVPNNIVGQWELMFTNLYPKAKVLTIEPKSFKPKMRQKVLTQMRDGDYDGIIIAYSCFEMIKFSATYAKDYINKRLDFIKDKVDEVMEEGRYYREITGKYDENSFFQQQKLLKEKDTLAKTLSHIFEECEYLPDVITFDQLEINTLFLDEAHNYKNLPIETHMDRVRGINTKGSKKCQDMLMKVRSVQDANGGRGAVFATGTPLCNSISDTFVMQTYLQEADMKRLHLDHFDNWVKTFAKPETLCELDVTTANYRMVKRFVRFHNLPELSKMFAAVSIFHAMTDSSELPNFGEYTSIVTKRSKQLEDYMYDIVRRTEKIRAKEVHPSIDNMLKVSTDGRKAALDLTLVGEEQPYDETSKIVQCVEKVFKLYNQFEGTTQLIFCDNSTPKQGKFNVYNTIKQRLIEKGVPKEEIAFVHSCRDEFAKIALYEKVNRGEVRVLLGSTFKLGIGANVQKRLKAIHHLDVPWRPADMVQREGRILRPGNLNDEVFIYRYITKDTFDAYSWQLLETKQRFINGLLAGTITRRNDQDVGDTVLNYAEVKALALGNPLVKARVEAANELSKLLTLQKRSKELRLDMASQIETLPTYIEKKQVEIEQCIKDIEYYDANKVTYTWEELRQLGKVIMDGLKENDYETTERVVAEYQGFKIILPAGMMSNDPFVYVERNGRYKLNYRMTDIGIMLRLNHLLDGLSERLDELELAKARLEDKLLGLEAEMSREENYGDQIMLLKEKLARLDRKLGVKANG